MAGMTPDDDVTENTSELNIKEDLSDEHLDKLPVSDGKDSNIITRFKHLIEEKKGWYERKRKNVTSPALNVSNSKAEIVSSILQHDKQNGQESSDDHLQHDRTDSEVEELVEDIAPSHEVNEVNKSSVNPEKLPNESQEILNKDSTNGQKVEKRSLLKFLRSATIPDIAETLSRESSSENIPKEESTISRFKLNLLRKVKSLDMADIVTNKVNGGKLEESEEAHDGKDDFKCEIL